MEERFGNIRVTGRRPPPPHTHPAMGLHILPGRIWRQTYIGVVDPDAFSYKFQ
jgi:hypothetical protein